MTLIILAAGLPATLFICLSIPGIQNAIKNKAQTELSKLLDSEVTIKDLAISPFNRITLRGVNITDINHQPAIKVDRLGAGISLVDLIFFGDLVVNYVEIIGLDGSLYKENPESQLNIENIVEALKPKDEKKKDVSFSLRINNILLRNIDFRYNILSEAESADNHFNRHHIAIKNLRGDISIPILSNDTYAADVYRLALEEQSGFVLSDLHGRLYLSPDSVTVQDLAIELPSSELNFSDLKLEFNGSKNIKTILDHNKLSFAIADGSYIAPADLACFFAPLGNFSTPMNVTLKLEGDAQNIRLNPLRISSRIPDDLTLDIEGSAFNLFESSGREVEFSTVSLKSKGGIIAKLLPPSVSPKVAEMIGRIGDLKYEGKVNVSERNTNSKGVLTTDIGDIEMDAGVRKVRTDDVLPLDYKADIGISGLQLGRLLASHELGSLTAKIVSEGKVKSKKDIETLTDITLEQFTFRGHQFTDIECGIKIADDNLELDVNSFNDNDFRLQLGTTLGNIHSSGHNLDFNLEIESFNPSALQLWDKFPGKTFSGTVKSNLSWTNLNDVEGTLSINNLSLTDGTDSSTLINSLVLNAEGKPEQREISLTSDILSFNASGAIDLKSLSSDLKLIANKVMPALVPLNQTKIQHPSINDFTFNAEIKETEWLTKWMKLPVSALAPVEINGSLNSTTDDADLSIDAPYLRQGNKLIENTAVNLEVNNGSSTIDVATSMPTNDGLNHIKFSGDLAGDSVNTSIAWKIDRERNFQGDVAFSTFFTRHHLPGNPEGALSTEIKLKPGILEFNDSTWHVNPALISIRSKDYIKIENLEAYRYGQNLKINGIASTSPLDVLKIELDNINLNYIFESLALENVQIGGDATGMFTGSALLSDEPVLLTDGLQVSDISYNGCVFGNAFIQSHWDADKRSVNIDADIKQANERHTFIRGDVFPLNDSLDLRFIADKVKVGFLRPYMKAFTDDIEGHATGNARLWGNFKYIDLEGNLYADSVRMKIGFTNTNYTASDSVIITPGLINLDNLRLTDDYGHTAVLNGKVTHTFFKQPWFEFNITDCRDLMVFDEPESRNPRWYGRVFADGSALVKGGPGFVDISCNFTTAQGSVFSFVLTDMQEAGEYTFITYRDRDYLSIRDSLIMNDPTPPLVKEFLARMSQDEDGGRSTYQMTFNLDVTPETQMNLVMDPVGGDRIRAYGNGNMRIAYGSNDEELKIYGTYTLDRGNYNFTLQDIIIKDFTIREGSSITFRGDPYTAVLDITAIYALTANLSDLDATFLDDKDLNRTNVPVHALLHVAGDLHQPDISFDLEFPTLTQDTYRKVKSIVSTEDMMNRQIIYLLALNRFYTPDYMQSATKGNELISVASSTLSSQLSNILSQISDKWTIAPSFKSERSDFSDMEVDLALSSTLLNNRLLLNGNFGYRDNTMNTNQFIGDFDVEYLLNRKGTLRLKAYNRYNDRNFYYKTAATTQGVGIVLKHDFDNFMSFLKFFQKKEKKSDEKEEKIKQ